MLISIKTFSGMIPRIGGTVLNPSQAQQSLDAKFWSGELRPLYEDRAIKELLTPVGPKYNSLYLYEHPSDGNIWLANEEELSIVKGPVLNDSKNRVYFVGLGDKMRVVDADNITPASESFTVVNSIEVAIPRPTRPEMKITAAGSGGNIESRSYLYTYIRKWDTEKLDEGQSSAPAYKEGTTEVTLDVKDDETVTLSKIAEPSGNNGVDYIAIYRSQTSTTETSYQLVLEFNIADGIAGTVPGITYSAGEFTFVDDKEGDELGEVLRTLDWTAPEDNLEGLISLNNGVLAAFKGNDVFFSEPGQPHAWPAKYVQTVDNKIVGLGHFGNNVVVTTKGSPTIINATDPASTLPLPINEAAPCESRKSIVNTGDSCLYASTYGLIRVSSGGVQLATQQLYSKDEWQALNPRSFVSSMFEGKFFTFYQKADGDAGAFVIDFAEGNTGVSKLSGYIEAFYVAPLDNSMYYIKAATGGDRYIWEFEGNTDLNKEMLWKTKKFQSNKGPVNFAAARVHGRFASKATQAEIDAMIARNEAVFKNKDLQGALGTHVVNLLPLNGDILDDIYGKYQIDPHLYFRFYVDGDLVHTERLENNLPFRLPSGLVGVEFEAEVAGNVPVDRIDIATSMRELQ